MNESQDGSHCTLFSYVKQVNKKKSDPSTKRQDYSKVCSALKRLGFPQDATNTIWKVLASVLHLGNLKFAEGEKEGTDIANKDVLKKIGSLLDVESMSELEESLTGRVIAAHGEVVRKLHNVDDAVIARDAFAKVIDTKNYTKQTQRHTPAPVTWCQPAALCSVTLLHDTNIFDKCKIHKTIEG